MQAWLGPENDIQLQRCMHQAFLQYPTMHKGVRLPHIHAVWVYGSSGTALRIPRWCSWQNASAMDKLAFICFARGTVDLATLFFTTSFPLTDGLTGSVCPLPLPPADLALGSLLGCAFFCAKGRQFQQSPSLKNLLTRVSWSDQPSLHVELTTIFSSVGLQEQSHNDLDIDSDQSGSLCRNTSHCIGSKWKYLGSSFGSTVGQLGLTLSKVGQGLGEMLLPLSHVRPKGTALTS